MEVTKVIEFDYGHRIPSHSSKCRHFHGHRGKLEVTLAGPIKPVRGESDDGMTLDFGDIKKVAMELIHDVWDHAFLVYEHDLAARDALKIVQSQMPECHHRTVVLSVVPTAENLAELAFEILDKAYQERFGSALRLSRVRFYETPGSWADAVRKGD